MVKRAVIVNGLKREIIYYLICNYNIKKWSREEKEKENFLWSSKVIKRAVFMQNKEDWRSAKEHHHQGLIQEFIWTTKMKGGLEEVV